MHSIKSPVARPGSSVVKINQVDCLSDSQCELTIAERGEAESLQLASHSHADRRAGRESGESASLSLGHNSNASIASPTEWAVEPIGDFDQFCAVQAQRELPFRLSGSQKKTAFALELNVARLCAEAGIECAGLLTLTVGDEVEGEPFWQIYEHDEANKRLNSLATGLLRDLFPRWVIVTERTIGKAIHFHLVVETKGDIRAGFDFDAFLQARTSRKAGYVDEEAERTYKAGASEVLRALWAILRERLPGYGFGRAELTPIYKTAEALSRYVSKYIEKNLFNRPAEDKGRRLVRYAGFSARDEIVRADGTRGHLRGKDFSWSTPKASEWRRKARAIAATRGIFEREQVAAAIGPRWAFRITACMFALNLPMDTDWHEGQMTREQTELSMAWLADDEISWGTSQKERDRQRQTWDRTLSADEVRELERDLEDCRLRQLQAGLGFEEAEIFKPAARPVAPPDPQLYWQSVSKI